MSGAVRSGGTVSITASVRKTIQNLKEIAGHHSDEEIYAMLKECSMDPNETAQKLLYQDPFHEVRRKRDKRKESVSNKDLADSRSRPGGQGRGGRGGRGNYPPRYISYDAGSSRGSNMSKENGGYHSVNRVNIDSSNPPLATSQNAQTKTNVPGTSSLPTTMIGAPVIPNGNSSNVCTPQVQAQVGGWSAGTGTSTMADVLKLNGAQQVQTQLQSAPPATSVIVQGQPMLGSQQYITSIISTSVSGVYSSSSDPVLVPSLDTRVSGAVGTIKREVGAQRLNVDQTTSSHDSKSALSNSLNSLQNTQSGISDAADLEAKVLAIENSTTVHSFSHDRNVSKSQTVDGDHRLSETQPQVTNSTSTASSVGRSSGMANHCNVRPPQFVGPQKVGPNKEWKPKATNQIASTCPGIIGTSTVSTNASEISRSPLPASNCVMSEDASKLQKKLEEMNIQGDQHVIMPNHLQVPEIERTGLSFGSFDANFRADFVKNPQPVFIFVDNALKQSDLDKLLPITDLAFLPAQSRILLTTRNLSEAQIILQANIELHSYLVAPLQQEEARKLLCEFSLEIGQENFDPTIGVEGLLQICQGVPLVLKIAGAELRAHAQNVQTCRDMVQYLKSRLLEGAEGEISECMVDFVYHRLDASCKEAFLDLVFFFCDWEPSRVAFAVGEIEFEKLKKAAIINITDRGTVNVHDIVRARGRMLSPEGERITDLQSLTDVLQDAERTKKTKGICLKAQFELEASHLNLMKRCLRVLILKEPTRIVNGECKGAFENLSLLSLDNPKNYSHMDVSKHPRLAVFILEPYRYFGDFFEVSGVASSLKYMYIDRATLVNLYRHPLPTSVFAFSSIAELQRIWWPA